MCKRWCRVFRILAAAKRIMKSCGFVSLAVLTASLSPPFSQMRWDIGAEDHCEWSGGRALLVNHPTSIWDLCEKPREGIEALAHRFAPAVAEMTGEELEVALDARVPLLGDSMQFLNGLGFLRFLRERLLGLGGDRGICPYQPESRGDRLPLRAESLTFHVFNEADYLGPIAGGELDGNETIGTVSPCVEKMKGAVPPGVIGRTSGGTSSTSTTGRACTRKSWAKSAGSADGVPHFAEPCADRVVTPLSDRARAGSRVLNGNGSLRGWRSAFLSTTAPGRSRTGDLPCRSSWPASSRSHRDCILSGGSTCTSAGWFRSGGGSTAQANAFRSPGTRRHLCQLLHFGGGDPHHPAQRGWIPLASRYPPPPAVELDGARFPKGPGGTAANATTPAPPCMSRCRGTGWDAPGRSSTQTARPSLSDRPLRLRTETLRSRWYRAPWTEWGLADR